MAYIYMLRCRGNLLYTGITTDLKKRMADHVRQTKSCAKFTKAHPVEEIAMVWELSDYRTAAEIEPRIKRLSRQEKETLVASPDQIGILLKKKFDYESEYALTPQPEIRLAVFGLA